MILTSGFGGTDASLNPLRWFLRSVGHDARPVGLGRISDDVEALSELVAEKATALAHRVGAPVALVGWSIGGVLSREAARMHPDVIHQVITFGTPVVGGPSYTSLSLRYSEEYLAEIRALIEAREQTPIEVPITAIWSRNDGVVKCVVRCPVSSHRVPRRPQGPAHHRDVIKTIGGSYRLVARRLGPGRCRHQPSTRPRSRPAATGACRPPRCRARS